MPSSPRLARVGSSLVFSTYLGGSLNQNTCRCEWGGRGRRDCCRPAGANIYVTGNTLSTDFPTM